MIRANKTRGVSWHTGLSLVVIEQSALGCLYPIQEERRKQLKN